MDEITGDDPEESFDKHLKYYRSLSKIIRDNEKEIDTEEEQSIKNHLKERIRAMNLDKERIEKMFPNRIEELRNE